VGERCSCRVGLRGPALGSAGACRIAAHSRTTGSGRVQSRVVDCRVFLVPAPVSLFNAVRRRRLVGGQSAIESRAAGNASRILTIGRRHWNTGAAAGDDDQNARQGYSALAGHDPCFSRDSAWRYEGFTKASQLSANIPLAKRGTAMMDVGNQRKRTTRRRPSVSPAAAIANALTEAFDPDKPLAVHRISQRLTGRLARCATRFVHAVRSSCPRQERMVSSGPPSGP
jgi:hypothetical protein